MLFRSSCVTTLGLTTHLVVDTSGGEVVDVDDDAIFVTSTTLPFPLSFRAGSCGSTPFTEVGSCVTARLRGTCLGGDGHNSYVALLSFRTHTILIVFDVFGCILS